MEVIVSEKQKKTRQVSLVEAKEKKKNKFDDVKDENKSWQTSKTLRAHPVYVYYRKNSERVFVCVWDCPRECVMFLVRFTVKAMKHFIIFGSWKKELDRLRNK